MTEETHQASPNQMLFFKRLFEIKDRIRELTKTLDDLRREDIQSELQSISDEFETMLRKKAE